MSSSRILNYRTAKQVKPLLSLNRSEARGRVITLYKAWYRQMPQIQLDYEIPKTEIQCRAKLRELFLKNKDVSDIRVIDLLVMKGQMELKETVKIWKQNHGLMSYWAEVGTVKKPKDFMGKFLDGH